jgi:hypothetical protein
VAAATCDTPRMALPPARGTVPSSAAALKVAITAGAGGVVAAGGYALAAGLDVFAPCRVLYRLQENVYGSLACQSYYAIVLFSGLLAFAACGLAGLAGILAFVRRRSRS